MAGVMIYHLTAPNVKNFMYKSTCTMNDLNLTWKKQKNTSSYSIYRTDVTDTYNDVMAAKSSYQKIAKINGTEISYTDQKVESGHVYSYYINAYNSFHQCVATTYMKGVMELDGVGLVDPDLINDGYGENYLNTEEVFYLYANVDMGVQPSHYIVYRKDDDSDQFKQIQKVKANNGTTIKDTTIKTGHSYTYKVRSYKKADGKDYYSEYSKPLTLSAYTAVPKYKTSDVKLISDHELAFKITSRNPANGPITFIKNEQEDAESSYYYYSGEEGNGVYYAYFSHYSTDGTTWTDIDDRITLHAGESLYLKLSVTPTSDSKLQDVYYASDAQSAGLVMTNSCIELVSSGVGSPEFYADFTKGEAKAYLEWD